MKYIYMILAMLSFSVFVYPELSVKERVQYYDMTKYEIVITPEKQKHD